MKSRLLLTILFFKSAIIFSQINLSEDYHTIKCEGDLPSDFQKLTSDKFFEDIEKMAVKDSVLFETQLNYHLMVNYELDKIIFSGRLLFGDPLTNYLNKVADEILKNEPKLRKKLSFYTFKSSTMNAACTSKGVIMVNVGLISRLKTEAQLAFVLCHEIAHYTKEHGLNTYLELEDLSDNLKSRKLSYDDIIDLVFKQSKNKEFEADSLGLIRFLNTDYSSSEALNTLEMLHFANLPAIDIPFDISFFDSEYVKLPKYLELDSVKRISTVSGYSDKHQTHPNIIKRKEKLEKIINSSENKNGNEFIISESDFYVNKELARFEEVRLDLLRRSYGKAIYGAYSLLQKYPNNKFLKMSIAKALYGLITYKNAKEYNRAAISYGKVQGNSQQIHFLLRKLSKVQLNTLTYIYIRNLSREYPNNQFLMLYKRDIIHSMVVDCEINFEEYFFKEKVTVPEKGFHKLAFINELKDQTFSTELKKYYAELVLKKERVQMAYRDKKKENKEIAKLKEINGLGINANRIIVLDPNYRYIKENEVYPNKSEKLKLKFDSLLQSKFKEKRLEYISVNSKKLLASNTASYNSLSSLKEWMQERNMHGWMNITPLATDQISDIIKKNNTKYLYYTQIDEIGKSYYYAHTIYYKMYLYDLETGHLIYRKSKKYQFDIDNNVNKVITNDINKIMN